MMKSKDKTFRQLLEQVREYDDLIVLPDEIKFNTRTKNNASISNLRRAVEDFNKFPNDKDSLMKLKRAFNNAMTVIIELLDENLQNAFNHRLEIKKKDYVIDNLKKYIESKEDLDAEIPSDEDEEEKIKEIADNIVKLIPTLIDKKIDLFSSKVNQNLNGI